MSTKFLVLAVNLVQDLSTGQRVLQWSLKPQHRIILTRQPDKNSAQFTSFRVSSSLALIRFVQNKVELVVVETEALLVSGSRWISSAV